MKTEVRHRFVSLDTLRGLCAIIVAIFHFKADSFITAIPLIKNGFLFVDFFFVLSGFVIAANYQSRIENGLPIKFFMFLRLGRLYPLHIFVLLLYVAVASVKSIDNTYTMQGFFVTAFLLQSFVPDSQIDIWKVGNWNFASWSIAAEVWTYLVVALLWRHFSSKFWLLVLLAIIALAPIILIETSDRYANVFFFPGGLARCLYGFAFGVFAFRYWDKLGCETLGRLSRVLCTALEAGILISVATLVSVAGAGPYSLLCAPTFAVAVIIFAREGGLFGSLFRVRALAILGTLSYSIYMTHEFVQARLLNAIHAFPKWIPVIDGAHTLQNTSALPVTDIAVMIMVLSTGALSFFTFTLIEEPLRKWSKGTLEHERKALA